MARPPRPSKFVDEVVQFEDTYRLCYIRGSECILVGLAQELWNAKSKSIRLHVARHNGGTIW